jgi:hypothetical protein
MGGASLTDREVSPEGASVFEAFHQVTDEVAPPLLDCGHKVLRSESFNYLGVRDLVAQPLAWDP